MDKHTKSYQLLFSGITSIGTFLPIAVMGNSTVSIRQIGSWYIILYVIPFILAGLTLSAIKHVQFWKTCTAITGFLITGFTLSAGSKLIKTFIQTGSIMDAETGIGTLLLITGFILFTVSGWFTEPR